MAPHTKIDAKLILDAISVTEAAAIAASKLIGKGDNEAADTAAVTAMRKAFHDLDIDGVIVIGEGERDQAPMLFIGEKVGTGKGQAIDIAIDPLEGTTITAKGKPGAMAVAAFAPRGKMLNAPDTYMEKIACGPGYPEGIIDLDKKPSEIAKAMAKHKGVKLDEISACVLDRPRHDEIIKDLRKVGCPIRLITDGDIAGAMFTAIPDSSVDLYLGTGGAPEGVLASAALKCLGGQFQARLVIRNDTEAGRARKWGIKDMKRKYRLDDIVSGDAVFVATGVTDGPLVKGVRKADGVLSTYSLVLESETRTIRRVTTRHLEG